MDYIPIIGGIFSLSMVKKVYKCKKTKAALCGKAALVGIRMLLRCPLLANHLGAAPTSVGKCFHSDVDSLLRCRHLCSTDGEIFYANGFCIL